MDQSLSDEKEINEFNTQFSDSGYLNYLMAQYSISPEQLTRILTCVADKNDVYELLYDASTNGVDQSITRAKSEPTVPYCFKSKNNEHLSWCRNPDFIMLEIKASDTSSVIVEDQYKCPRCKCTSIAVASKQMRRADEPETNIYTCTMCACTWKI